MPNKASSPGRPKNSAQAGLNKSQFIRDHIHLTPKQTLEKARAAGIELSPALLHSARHEVRKKEKNAAANFGNNVKAPSSSAPNQSTASAADKIILDLIDQQVRGVKQLIGRLSEPNEGTKLAMRALLE